MTVSEIKQKLQKQYDQVDGAIYSPYSIGQIIDEIKYLTGLLIDKLE